MRACFVLLGLLAFAAASCPNQCSGHGRCGTNDKCECYTQVNTPWGARPMYSGADCSLRTCPLGTAPDAPSNYNERVGPIALSTAASSTTGRTDLSGALGVYLSAELQLPNPSVTIQLAIVTASASGYSFKWKYIDDAAWSNAISFTPRDLAPASPPISDATEIMLLDPPQSAIPYLTSGNTQTETGIRVYFDPSTELFQGDVYTFTVTRATGAHWVISNDNSLHQPTECSTRGLCDTTTGKCKCFTGFGGEACQRTSCPNDCSGHGICQSEYQFRQDAIAQLLTGTSYGSVSNYYTDPFDAQRQLGCKCDDGYRGADCSLIECPSGNDPLTTTASEEANEIARDCSGRGICDYTVGQCKCFKGYFGERCESQTNFV